MRGFITACIVLSLVITAAAGCKLYGDGVIDETEAMVTSAQNGEDMLRAAEYMEKEKRLMRITVSESLIDGLIADLNDAAALWDAEKARHSAMEKIFLRIESLRRSFGVNPL